MAMSMSVPIFELLCEVLNVAKKASSIARLIRDERNGMFQKLVEEKTGDSKNLRFAQDYKTLADVIIQETIRKDLGEKFPPVLENILGEESNKFTNSSGELVTVSVLPTCEETRDHLETVLGGNQKLASRLAEVIHAPDDDDADADNNDNNAVDSSSPSFSRHEDVLPFASRLSAPIPLQSLGIWVDPIDSTAEYIKGVDGNKFRHHGILVKGLQSAVILIGIFDRVTGEPILGVIYQPFGEKRRDAAAPESIGAGDKDAADPDRTPQFGGDMEGLLFADSDAASEPEVDAEEKDNGTAAHSCWQERYTWGVCYGDIKLYSSGGASLPNNSASFSPHSSFSFHSFPGGGVNGSKGSQDFSSASSLLPSSSQLNNTSHDNRNHSHHSTSVCNDNDQKPNSSSSAPPPLSSPSSASLGAGFSPFGASGASNPVGTKLLLIGGAEGSRDSTLLLPFRKEFTVVRAAGAGYKLLCLCDDLAHAYLLTKPTTYRWDTCAPHAILKAKGGNVYNWQKLSEKCRQFVAGGGGGGGSKELLREMVQECGNSLELKYHLEEGGEQGAQRFKNSGGVLAVSGSAGLASVLRPLLESSRSQSELSQTSQRMRSQSQLSSQDEKRMRSQSQLSSQSQKSMSQLSQQNQQQQRSLSQLSQISSSQPSQQVHQLRSQSQLSQMSSSQTNQQLQQQRSQSQLSQMSRPSSDRGSVSQSRQSPPHANSVTSPVSDASSCSIIDGFARRTREETSSKSAAVAKQLDVMIDMGDLLLPEKTDDDEDVGLSLNSSLKSAEEQETSLIIGKH